MNDQSKSSKSKKDIGIYTADDLYDSVMSLYKGEKHKQFSTGYGNLDEIWKIVKPCFVVITGVPNCGKSSLTMDILMHQAKKYGHKFTIFSPEHSLEMNVLRLCEKYHQKPYHKMFKTRLSEVELGEAIVFVAKHFFFIDRYGSQPDINWIVDRAKMCKDKYDIFGLIIDPYNEIDPMRSSNLREDEHISVVISKIKRFNRETDTMSILIAHPNKQIRNAEGKFVCDSLYSISGSAHFYNKTDVGIIISRDADKEMTTVAVRKVREIDVYGQIGECILKYSTRSRCFHTEGDFAQRFGTRKKSFFNDKSS